MSARYHESPSELFSSIVVHAVLMPRRAGRKERLSRRRRSIGIAGVDVVAAQQVPSARSGIADVTAVRPAISRCRLTFHTCTCGVSTSHCIGRIERPDVRSNGAFGNVGFANTTRGVAGGLVTVTIRFCELLVLK